MKWLVLATWLMTAWLSGFCCCDTPFTSTKASQPSCHDVAKPACHGAASETDVLSVASSCSCDAHERLETRAVVVAKVQHECEAPLLATLPVVFAAPILSPVDAPVPLIEARGHGPDPTPIRLSRFLM